MIAKAPSSAVRAGRVAGLALRGVWLLALLRLAAGPCEALFAAYGNDLDSALPARALGHFEAMEAHFEAPFHGYGRTSVLVPQFGVILLSHAAIGFLNVALSDPALRPRACASLGRVSARAVDDRISPYGEDPREVGRLSDYNLYLSHLSLILGARRLACEADVPERDDMFHTRINGHLRRRSLTSPNAHARSFPGLERFPADQAATLASMHLYDLGHGTTHAQTPIRAWLRTMAREENGAEHGLHRSCLDPFYPHATHARGCALSWTSMYMPQFARDEARELYTRYRSHYAHEVAGLGGFREYAPDVNARMDADSGPILFGMGVAATGLALGAARLHNDSETYHRIMQTAATVGNPSVLGTARTYLLAPMLGEAILFHASTSRIWDGETPHATSYERTIPWGTLLYLLVLGWLIARSARAMRASWRAPTSKASEEAHG